MKIILSPIILFHFKFEFMMLSTQRNSFNIFLKTDHTSNIFCHAEVK